MNRPPSAYEFFVNQAQKVFGEIAEEAFYTFPTKYYNLLVQMLGLPKEPEQGDPSELSQYQYRDLLVVSHCRSLWTIPNMAARGFPEETTALCRQMFERVCNLLWLADNQQRFQHWATHNVEHSWIGAKNRYEQGLTLLFRRMVERGLLRDDQEAQACADHKQIMSDAYTTLSAFAHGNPMRTIEMSLLRINGQEIITPGPKTDGHGLGICIVSMQHLCMMSTIVAQLYATYQLPDETALSHIYATDDILEEQRKAWKNFSDDTAQLEALLTTKISRI